MGTSRGLLAGVLSPWECCELMAMTDKQSKNNTGGQVWAKRYHRTATLESYQRPGDTGTERMLGIGTQDPWSYGDTQTESKPWATQDMPR